jgi:hypothetical protein
MVKPNCLLYKPLVFVESVIWPLKVTSDQDNMLRSYRGIDPMEGNNKKYEANFSNRYSVFNLSNKDFLC